jgi:isopenicillin-N epimerase
VEFLGRHVTNLMAESRAALADYLGAQRDDLVYVTNATVGVNIVARSLNLGPGDEVLTTDHEYGACDRTWRFLARKKGFTYINQPVSVPLPSGEDFVEQLWQGVTARTKIIFLSHIASPTAIIFPVTEVCRRAREQGILTLVDGAHAPGQIPLNLDQIGADYYTGNLHKWLCAPKGAGFLYACPEAQDLLEPLVVSWGWESEMPGTSQFVDHHEWQGTRDLSAFLAVPTAIRFQRENDWARVQDNCHALAVEVEMKIRGLTDLPSLYIDDSWFAQMVTVSLPVGTDRLALKEFLYHKYRIEVPLIEWRRSVLLRISVQGYNLSQDIDALIRALTDWGSANI